jgi:hypothetical protein
MKIPSQYDAVLGNQNAPCFGAVLGGKVGFNILLEIYPEQAIQTEIGRQKLNEVIASFNTYCESEQGKKFTSWVSSDDKSRRFRLRKYKNDVGRVRIYAVMPFQYAGYITEPTLFDNLSQYFPDKCNRSLRSIICKKLLLLNLENV